MLNAAIDRLFAQWVGPSSPGAVVGVTRHGALIHEGAYGMADIAHGIALERRSVIRIGSQSKQFTVLLALMLEAEGKLSMDDDVHRHAPWLPPFPHKVSLHHLATNTGGLRDFLEIMIWNGLPLASESDRALSRRLLSRHGEVNYVPGSQMLYSNTGFFLLSEIIEEVSGRSFNELLAHYIIDRVGMPDTRLQARDAEIVPRLANMHQWGPAGWETARWGFPLGGEGGMVSTLTDMLAWQATLANPPADWQGHLARMTAPLRYTNGTETLYRMGLVVDRYRGARGIGHGGGVAGGKSESIRFPEHGLGVVILGNLSEMAPFSLARRIADAALEGSLTPRHPPQGAIAMCAAAGVYREIGSGEVFILTEVGGAPIFRSLGSTSSGATAMEEVAPGSFAPERPTAHLTLTPAGDGILEAVFCGVPTRYRKVAPPHAAPRDISGNYANRALGLNATLATADGMTQLLVRSDVGVIRADLEWLDADLLAVHPPGQMGLDATFIATLRLVDGGVELTTDRTKRLRLMPA